MQNRPGPDIVAGNRLMIQGDHHYDYDAFGNLIRERRCKGHTLVTEYRYDCQHRLIGTTQPNGQTASYRYDPFGRRISKTVDGITTEFFWQGDTLIAEHHANRHRSYLYEPDTFRPLALLEGFGPKETKAYHYQLDHLGTPQELRKRAALQPPSLLQSGYRPLPDAGPGEAGGWDQHVPVRAQSYGLGGPPWAKC
ncbi:hypothetical protein AO284_28750 [Pseudomonas sp. NZIPFR-PS2]|nr:hypothetical protein AO284_28750 [Pseudomonas sp. NZIPFR-PS2]